MKRIISWLKGGGKRKEEVNPPQRRADAVHTSDGLPTLAENDEYCPTCGRPSLDVGPGGGMNKPSQQWARRRMSLNANHPYFAGGS